MSKTIQSKGELWLPQDKFDNRNSSNTLEEGLEYNIIDPVGYATAKYVDDKVSTKTSVTVNGSNVATFDADTKQDVLDGSSPIYVNNNSVGLSYSTGLKVENGDLQVDLYGNDPIYVDGSYIYLNYSNGLTYDSSGLALAVYDGSGLTTENGSLEISSNVLNRGLYDSAGAYVWSCNGMIEVNSIEDLTLRAERGNVYINTYEDTSSYKVVLRSGANGVVIDGSTNTTTMGTLSDLSGEVDKTKPYIEITETAVNIKGLTQIS